MTRRFMAVLAAVISAIAIFAGTAGADGLHGISGGASTNSFSNGFSGTCIAAEANASHSQSYASNARGYPFPCFLA